MKKIITILLLTAPVIGLAQKVTGIINFQKNYIDPKQYDKVIFPKAVQFPPDILKKLTLLMLLRQTQQY